MTPDMMTVANKLASDELHAIQRAEISALRSENIRLRARLGADTTEYEIAHGKVVWLRGNDARRDPPRLPSGKAPAPTNPHPRRA